MKENDRKPVQAAQTTFQVIEALHELQGAKVKELADHLDLPKSTVHNYLSTLEQTEYLFKEDGTYYTSLRFLSLGERARNRHQIYETAKPELKDLATETGELINLLVEEHGRGVYVYRTKGSKSAPLHTYVGGHVGERTYLHSCAPGKAILAHLPDDHVESILDRYGMPAVTEHTIRDRDVLDEELERIRNRGVAFDDEEHYPGLRSVAAPVCRDGTVHGAISISGPRSQMGDERIQDDLVDHVQDVANVVEINMTFS